MFLTPDKKMVKAKDETPVKTNQRISDKKARNNIKKRHTRT